MKRIPLAAVCLLFAAIFANSARSQDIEPTDEEQYMLELINRVRMNPAAEGAWLANHPDRDIQSSYDYFNVDRQNIIDDFKTYPPVPPLAFNEALIRAARRHSKDMKDNNFQGHNGTDGSNLSTRITDTGYQWYTIGENVFAYGQNVEHAHAGFVVDWGVPSLGHRKNTLEYENGPVWKEIGIGILRTGSAKVQAAKRVRRSYVTPDAVTQQSQVGPLIVTIDFAAPFQYTPQVLGVVYQDLNENGLYDIGEGLGGVSIQIENPNQKTVTYSSGGYAIPIAKAGEYEITASGGLLAKPITKTVSISEDNVKIDFRLGEETFIPDWALYN